MRLALACIFTVLAIAAFLFNAYLIYRYHRGGRGSSPVALLVALPGTLAIAFFQGSSLGGASYLAIFAGLFILSILASFPIAYFGRKK